MSDGSSIALFALFVQNSLLSRDEGYIKNKNNAYIASGLQSRLRSGISKHTTLFDLSHYICNIKIYVKDTKLSFVFIAQMSRSQAINH